MRKKPQRQTAARRAAAAVVDPEVDSFLSGLTQKLSAGAATGESQQLRKYGNIVEWVEKGLGLTSVYEHVKEYQTVRDFYELLCPECNDESDLDSWGKTPAQLQREVLLRLDWDREVFVCPECGFTRHRLMYEMLVACIGMRAGKTITAGMIASYTTMMWFALGGHLEKRFKLVPGQHLRISMVSTASAQTEKTVWAAYAAMMANLIDPAMQKCLLTGLQVDDHATAIKDPTALVNTKEWKYSNLEIMSLHSNSGSLAGGTGLFTVLEEYSRFDLGESKRSAEEVFLVLDRALKTVRQMKRTAVDDLFGRLVVIGSPYYPAEYDPTLQLIAKPRAKQMSIHLPTWKFNPHFTREDFDEDYRLNWWKSERDYGANPKGGADVFFENQEAILDCIQEGKGLQFYQVEQKKGDVKFVTATVVNTQGVDPLGQYVVHVDLSEKHDIMSMAFAKQIDTQVVVVGIMALKASGGMSIWIDTPMELILQLAQQLNIKLVTFDGWNSVSAIQRLNAAHIPTRRRSIGETELEEYKKLSYLKGLQIIDTGDSAVDVLSTEVKTIRRINGVLSHVDVLMSVSGSVTNLTLGEMDRKVGKYQQSAVKLRSAKVIRFNRW